ncbi:MAG: CARDB domain-containing protein [Myxococcota bacterium]
MPIAAPKPRWLLALLAAGCSEYQFGGDKEAALADSSACVPCDLAPPAPGVVGMDATCTHPSLTVDDAYDIVVKRELTVDTSWGSTHGGVAAPLVADLDGDGTSEIILTDCPLVSSTSCAMAVFDAGGTPLWSVLTPELRAPYAAVDLDGLPGAELLVPRYADERLTEIVLVALRGDGTELWTFTGDWDPHGPLVVADLAGDGSPEILSAGLILDAATGARRGAYDAPHSSGGSIAVADVDLDGTQEFATGGSLLAADGSARWALASDWRYGLAIALQADADAAPEFVFVSAGFLVVDGDGTVLVERDVPGLDWTSTAVADVDGDGVPDIVVERPDWTTAAYHLDGSLVWERDDPDWVLSITGWDVDADGASELIVQTGDSGAGDGAVKILSGRDGSLLWSAANVMHGEAAPIVADIDGDGHAELLVTGGQPRETGGVPSLTIYHQAADTWPAAGPAWPVPNYAITDVGPAGELPRGEADPPAWTYGVFHARPAVDGQGVDLSLAAIDTCFDRCGAEETVQLAVSVSNTGPRPAHDVVLRVYAGETAVAEDVLPRIGAGEAAEGVILTVPAGRFDLGAVRVVADPDDALPECDESNNELPVVDPRW